MGKTVKIALGCGCLVVLAAVVLVIALGYGASWAKQKLGQVTGGFERAGARTAEIEEWERKANAHPYTAPADGVITEDRLLAFLGTRRSVFAVYERYRAELAELSQKSRATDKPSFSDAIAAGGKVAEVFGELRAAQMRSLAEVGMSEEEYRAIQWAVYKTAWAAETQERSGKLPSEAMEEASEQLQAGTRKGLEEAREQGVPGLGQLSPEDQKKLQEAMAGLDQAAKAMEVPAANVELFRKHEAEIKKYAMTGLELLGF